jgi:hypothetical protein
LAGAGALTFVVVTRHGDEPATPLTTVAVVSPPTTVAITAYPEALTTTTAAAPVFYADCDAVRAAGAAPLKRGEPGYRTALDRNHNGVACEP